MDNVRSTPRIADVVRSLTPDIVCFQEIHRKLAWSAREDQPAKLKHLLNRQFDFQSNVRFGLGQYGIGIAHRSIVAQVRNHFLPGDKEQRGAIELTLRVGGLPGVVTVYCTHWGLDEEERLSQAHALAEIINRVSTPVIVCGDLNEPSTGSAVRALLRETGLMDADADLNRPTFTSDAPTVRIDYCFYSCHFNLKNVEVVKTLASDHLPLLVDLDRVR